VDDNNAPPEFGLEKRPVEVPINAAFKSAWDELAAIAVLDSKVKENAPGPVVFGFGAVICAVRVTVSDVPFGAVDEPVRFDTFQPSANVKLPVPEVRSKYRSGVLIFPDSTTFRYKSARADALKAPIATTAIIARQTFFMPSP